MKLFGVGSLGGPAKGYNLGESLWASQVRDYGQRIIQQANTKGQAYGLGSWTKVPLVLLKQVHLDLWKYAYEMVL